MEDTRVQGRSYGYVVVPEGGLKLMGRTFREGPRATGRAGWHKKLLEAGCPPITEEEYESRIRASQGLAAETGVKPVTSATAEKAGDDGAVRRPGDAGGDRGAARADKPKLNRGGRTRRVAAGAPAAGS